MSLIIPNLLIFLISNVPQAFSSYYHPSSDYCKLNCGRNVHTVCHRKNDCGPEPGCEYIPMTVKYREEILHYMNEFRDSVANGKIGSNYGNRGAMDMYALSYDLELEYIASCWANICQWKSDNNCRKTSRFTFGQTINRKSGEVNMKGFVDAWASSVGVITASLINSFRFGSGKGCPTCFTGFAWSTTKFIGCALSRSHKTNMTMIVCNYAPRGLIVGKPVYHMVTDASQIASECKTGKNEKYPSLCGEINPIPTEQVYYGESNSSSCFSDGIVLLSFAVVFGLIS